MAKPDKEEKQELEEVVSEETQEGAEGQSEEQKPEEDRPEINYKKELERKTAELAKLRAERDAVRSQPQKRDSNDISTWADHELKAVIKSNDPSVAAYKDQAEEILFDRRVTRVREKERMDEKRALSDLELRSKFPESLDSTSEFALKMEQVMHDYDLQKSPAGRLAAAKIVAAEMGKGRSVSTALDRNKESSRVRDVKNSMVDGDRSKSTESKISPKKVEELESRIRGGDARAVGEVLNLDAGKFFGKK